MGLPLSVSAKSDIQELEKPFSKKIVKQNPKVSVGLAVYNGGRMLEEAIESILTQDFPDFELIISDNASTDSTQAVCNSYQEKDDRIRYYRFNENLGLLKNAWRAFQLADAPYFMWATHDDLHEKSFIRMCLERISSDPTIALVYPRTRVLNAKNEMLGIAEDHINADQEDMAERYMNLIWNLGMGNARYGLFRTDALQKTRAFFYKFCRGGDSLLLSEIALYGKIIQIEDILFVRRVVDSGMKSIGEINREMIDALEPQRMMDGITLPFCRMAYAHLELINAVVQDPAAKGSLMEETVKCFKTRYIKPMLNEINRALELIDNGHLYYTWDNQKLDFSSTDINDTLKLYYLDNFINTLKEACFLFPEIPRLKEVHQKCLQDLFGSRYKPH